MSARRNEENKVKGREEEVANRLKIIQKGGTLQWIHTASDAADLSGTAL